MQETHSSSEHVVIIEEEDKESDFSQSIESLKPQAAVNMKPQPVKKMPARSEEDMGKADKLIIFSKLMTERVFLKLNNFFLAPDPSEQKTSTILPNKI
jgi:hypothetical protein